MKSLMLLGQSVGIGLLLCSLLGVAGILMSRIG